eukprot:2907831-Pyramimonas_sp.AAC.1
MENVWGYSESRGCKLAFERPFLDGASEDRKRLAHGQEEAVAKPLAQPAGWSASGAAKSPPRYGDPQEPKPPPPATARPPVPPTPKGQGGMAAA